MVNKGVMRHAKPLHPKQTIFRSLWHWQTGRLLFTPHSKDLSSSRRRTGVLVLRFHDKRQLGTSFTVSSRLLSHSSERENRTEANRKWGKKKKPNDAPDLLITQDKISLAWNLDVDVFWPRNLEDDSFKFFSHSRTARPSRFSLVLLVRSWWCWSRRRWCG